jgi:hypothetical protein
MPMSSTEFRSWLRSSNSAKCILVEVLANTGTQEKTLYLSNYTYITKNSDVPSNIAYLPILKSDLSFSESISLTSDPSISFGDISFDNTNGELDPWVNYVWSGRVVKIFIGGPEFNRSDFILVFKGIVSDIAVKDNRTLSLQIRSTLDRLNAPIYDVVLGPYGTKGPLNQNKESLRPLCFGEVHNISPLLVDDVTLTYMVHDGPIERIIEVRDNGVPVPYTANLSNGTFTLTFPSSGTITCSVQGDRYSMDEFGFISEGYDSRIVMLAARIIRGFGRPGEQILASELDLTSISQFLSNNTQVGGIYLADRNNILQVCQELLSSIGAQLTVTRESKVKFTKIISPESFVSDSIRELDTTTFIDKTFTLGDKLPVYSAIKLGYCKNWTLQDSLNTAIPEEHKDMYSQEWVSKTVLDTPTKNLYKQNSEPEQRDTLLISDANSDVTNEAIRLLNLYKVPRFTYSAVCTPDLYDIQVGDVVNIKFPRYGLDNGKKAQVLSSSINWNTCKITLEVLV